jgi:glyceraldehyde 3-phosphate dehydrogenase
LYRDHGVVVRVWGERLVHASPVEIVRLHRRGHEPFGHDVSLVQTREVLEGLAALELAPVEIDVGKLLAETAPEADAVEAALARAASLPKAPGPLAATGRDVVLYGFGRIGRILARLLIARAGGGEKYRLRAFVVREQGAEDLERRANLLRHDSVHGTFDGTVEVLAEEGALLVNGTKVLMITASAPETIDYTRYGIHDAIVIDNTGAWRDRKGLERHLAAKGVAKVILTAPGKGDVPNLVYGVNHTAHAPEERILSAASCTTNAIVPVLKAVHDRYGIESGHIETVHAYTNDQNLIDNYHKKTRRGRGAAMNMVLTETGAASAAAKAMPELKGKLTANAIRVPTPNVSMAIMMLRLGHEVGRDELNAFLREVAYASPLQEQVGWTAMTDTVSSDMVGESHAGVVDGEATIAQGRNVVLYVWYDNEWGYSCQVMRLLNHAAGLSRPLFP